MKKLTILFLILLTCCVNTKKYSAKINYNDQINIQRTLSILKPDATSRKLVNLINNKIEANGLKIIAQKSFTLTKDQAEEFYNDHKNKDFFPQLIKFMTSNKVVIQVLEGVDAINKYRQLMGSTNPDLAKKGTIRHEFAKSVTANTVHGSDSVISARREIDYFFTPDELTKK